MFGFIKQWVASSFLHKKAEEKPLLTAGMDGFRLAGFEHVHVIFENLLIETKNGHFNSDYMHPKIQCGLKHQIECSITRYVCPIENEELESCIYILVKNSTVVGFSWIREFEKSQLREYELYHLVVFPQFRGQGFGKKITEESIKQFPSGTKFHVRFLGKSEVMRSIAIAQEFKGNDPYHLSYISS